MEKGGRWFRLGCNDHEASTTAASSTRVRGGRDGTTVRGPRCASALAVRPPVTWCHLNHARVYVPVIPACGPALSREILRPLGPLV
jgi:hypothetical protein